MKLRHLFKAGFLFFLGLCLFSSSLRSAHASLECVDFIAPIESHPSRILGEIPLEGGFRFFRSRSKRESLDQSRLKVVTLNLQMLVKDPTGVTDYTTKSERERDGIGELMRSERPDLILVQEVSDEETLQRFSDEQFSGTYEAVVLRPYQSERMSVGVLIKKSLPFDVGVQGYERMHWNWDGTRAPVFHHDLLTVSLYKKGTQDREHPLLSIVNLHNKAPTTSRERDPNSIRFRRAQIEATQEVVERYKREYGPHLPTLVGGDFNGELRLDRVQKGTYEFGAFLTNRFELLLKNSAPEEATAFSRGRGNQFDGFWMSASLKRWGAVLRSGVLRYFDSKNPPSDHRPVFAVVDMTSLLEKHTLQSTP